MNIEAVELKWSNGDSEVLKLMKVPTSLVRDGKLPQHLMIRYGDKPAGAEQTLWLKHIVAMVFKDEK